MIQSEEAEKQNGYLKRIQMLKEFKRMALVDQDVARFGKNIEGAKKSIGNISGSPLLKRNAEKDTCNRKIV